MKVRIVRWAAKSIVAVYYGKHLQYQLFIAADRVEALAEYYRKSGKRVKVYRTERFWRPENCFFPKKFREVGVEL